MYPPGQRASVLPESDQRLNSRRAPGWNPAGKQAGTGYQQARYEIEQPVAGRGFEQEMADQSRSRKGQTDAGEDTNEDDGHALADNHRQHTLGLSADGHADTDLLRATRNRKRESAIKADRTQ